MEQVEKRVAISEPDPKVEVPWKEIRDRVCGAFGVSVPEVMHRGRQRRMVRIRRVMGWVGREVSGFTHQEMAGELKQDPAVLSRGLGKLSEELGKDRGLRRLTQTLCENLRKGRRPKRSIKSA